VTHLTARLTRVLELGRARVSGDSLHLARIEAFEQLPKCALLATEGALRIVAANEAMRLASGCSESQLIRLSITDLFRPKGDDKSLLHELRDPSPQRPIRARQHTATGTTSEVEIIGYRVRARGKTLLAFITQDITLRDGQAPQAPGKQGRLDHLAHHDQLTGLPNRLFLAAHLPNALQVARRNGALLAILCVGLDRFKHTNDSDEHSVDDRLLQQVVQRIRIATRDEDLVVRMQGDEFVIVLRKAADLQQVNAAAARIIETLSQPFQVDEHRLTTRASMGLSVFPRDGTDMAELLRHSIAAMYHAKDRP
jgi:diguanylate cyclase (GGDEF)-like protein